MVTENYRNKVFIVDKESGPTSFEVVEAFRRATGIRKVGHAGTLDPLARGVLLLCTDKATRAVEHFMDLPKEYEFEVRLGAETTTLDAEGEVVEQSECPELSREEIESVVRGFLGEYEMEPPAYSAIKKNGRRLYEMARAGETPRAKRRKVKIYDIEVIAVDLPAIRCKVRCSRGTYVRAMARDIGARLGVPAHLGGLVRCSIGPFHVTDGFPSRQLFQGRLEGLIGIPLAEALEFLPGIVVRDRARRALFDGACPTVSDVVSTIGAVGGARIVRIIDEAGDLLAVGHRSGGAPGPRLSWVDSYRLLVDRPN